MSENIKLPESVVQDLQTRQTVLIQINTEINLILKTFMSTITNNKVYRLSEDLTELICIVPPEEPNKEEIIEAIEEVKEDGESVSK